MRMTELPVLDEVKAEYAEHRYNGLNREEAVQALMESYECELEYGEEDDALLFWIGLADAQYSHKELTEQVAEKAMQALDSNIMVEWEIAQGDITRRKEHYKLAPMPEKKFGKRKPKFRCQWKIGDTFAYQMNSEEAKELGIHGKYMLLRKVSEIDFCGRIIPIVTVTLWNQTPFPNDDDAFAEMPMLKVNAGGRCFSPEDRYEYRTEIIIMHKKQLEKLGLLYIGNFKNIPMPVDEIVFEKAGYLSMTLPEKFEKDMCIHWKNHLYCQNR